jgi:dTDP-4-amino-4,6-dideoxygalactose transaminase
VLEPVLLSAPWASDSDIDAVVAALRSGWLAPAGPGLAAFERDVSALVGVGHAVGLASGTAGLHLGLKYLGVKPGDAVLIPTATFAATAFAVTYLGAIPVFVDVDDSWNMDPECVEAAIIQLRASGSRVSAAVPVDLYGTPANHNELLPLFSRHGIPVLEDAAEGLGAMHGDQAVGSLGVAGVISFNGNKLLTTTGGGIVVTDDAEFAEKVRYWATQSRDDYPWYEHSEIGYNYRLSNVLAALGSSQLRRVHSEVERRRNLREIYRHRLSSRSGVQVQEDPAWGTSNAWLTIVTFDSKSFPGAAFRVRDNLASANIESRPTWKPMHQQPVFFGSPTFLNGRADKLFEEGLCLPSGAGVTTDVVERICAVITRVLESY